MSCPFVAKAIIKKPDNAEQVIRLCMAIPRERETDPLEMPQPSVCFSTAGYEGCFHFLVMCRRGEPGVEQPEEVLPEESAAVDHPATPAHKRAGPSLKKKASPKAPGPLFSAQSWAGRKIQIAG
jgi:hypothetical protein